MFNPELMIQVLVRVQNFLMIKQLEPPAGISCMQKETHLNLHVMSLDSDMFDGFGHQAIEQ